MRRVWLFVATLALTASVLVGNAAGAKPVVVEDIRFDPNLTGLDSELSAACGFDIFATLKGHFRVTVYFNNDGSVRRFVSHPSVTQTLTSEYGATIETSDRGVDKVTPNPDGTLSIHGTGIHLKVKGEAYAIGLWRLVVDPDSGELLNAEYHGKFDVEADEILPYLCDRLGP